MRKILSYCFIVLLLYCFFFPKNIYASAHYYSFDATPHYLNRFSFIDRQPNDPPKPFSQLIEDYDTMVFLSSVQGLVNRSRPSFYLLSSSVDTKWLNNFREQSDVWPWLATATNNSLATVDDVITVFKSGYGIRGSVVWDGEKPFTLAMAATIAGTDNLIIVRKNSVLYNKITEAFPVQIDLTGRFETKVDGYNWLLENYLRNKHNPILAQVKDGDPLYLYLTKGVLYQRIEQDEVLTWGNLSLDYYISKGAFIFDLATRADVVAEDDFTSSGDFDVLSRILQIARANTDTSRMLEVDGFPNEKYVRCGQFGHDYVQCGEWSFVQLMSKHGAANRVGSGEWWGMDTPNFSFYKNGPGTDFVAQPPPLTPHELRAKNYVIGLPYNFSFENDRNAGNWTADTTNAVVYDEGGSHGSNFLEVNVSDVDRSSHNSVYQDVPLHLMRGQNYHFSSHIRSPSRTNITVNQTLWGFSGRGADVLCQNTITISSREWQPVECNVAVVQDDYTTVRLQIYLETTNTNYDIDEIYFDGPNTLVVNPDKKFLTQYLGDYDYAASAYVGTQIDPAGIHSNNVDYLPNWDHKSSGFPVGWSFSSVISEEIPPIYAYLAKTKGSSDWFIMPDSGAGYINAGSIPPQYVQAWTMETTNLHRQFGYRTGFILDGLDGYQNPWGAEMGDRMRNMYKVIAPEGAMVASGLAPGREYLQNYALLRMDSFSFAAETFGDMANSWRGFDVDGRHIEGVVDLLPGRQFLALRNPWMAPDMLKRFFDWEGVTGPHPEVINLDPITFFYLYKVTKGLPTLARSTLVAHNLPTYLEAGKAYNISLTVRNDGWDTWIPKPGNNCNGNGEGHGCVALAWGLNRGVVDPQGTDKPPTFNYDQRVDIPTAVRPGESTTLNFILPAPQEVGKYSFETDMIKELEYFFQYNGNVPWQKEIMVVAKNPDFNTDGVVNFEDVDQTAVSYGAGGNQFDINQDGAVNVADIVKIQTQVLQ